MLLLTRRRAAALSATALTALAASLIASIPSSAAPPPPLEILDDFEYAGELPSGTDGDGVAIGYSTFAGAGSTISLADPGTPPAPALDAAPAPNHVLQLDLDVASYAGVIHSFENAAGDAWEPRDLSAYAGFTMWLYGEGSGTTLFVDILENRNPGSTADDAQRWTAEIVDDVSGWREIEIPFTEFTEKVVGNGAPRDDFERTEVHGWALGALGTNGPRTYYVDNVGVYGVAPLAELAAGFTTAGYSVTEGVTGEVTVRLTRTLRDEDPDAVTVDYAVEDGTAVTGRDFLPSSGTLTFVKGGPREMTFPLETVGDDKHQGDRNAVVRLSAPVGMELGSRPSAYVTIVDDDAVDALLLDDFETYPYLWEGDPGVELDNVATGTAAIPVVPGQGDVEHVLSADVPVKAQVDVAGRLCNLGNGVVPVALLSTAGFDATTVDPATAMLGDASAITAGAARAQRVDTNGDGLTDLRLRFRFAETGLGCDAEHAPFSATAVDGSPVGNGSAPVGASRDFAVSQDWSSSQGLTLWYLGQGTGDAVTVSVLDNRAASGPDDWALVWSDEFDGVAGSAPDPATWAFDLGDGTGNGNPGWGNDELQYYTDSTDNAAADGDGHMVITARAADGGQQCYYGPCEYTSARLLSQERAEFAYGRIESRIKVPSGPSGLWPAFWSLGTDIDRVGWPQTGEIDIMEYVSRIPDTAFGTIHGPGYAGGESYGDIIAVPDLTADFHTYAIEWEPDLITWFVDDVVYHTATPEDVAPNPWVFNDPVFLLLNMAIGGNFGGALSPDLSFPQEMSIDYVRVYQGPDTAERFDASFVDDFTGWQQVTVPFSALERSDVQPAGAPDDGLGLDEVWGYGIAVPGGTPEGRIVLDGVRLADDVGPAVVITDDVDVETATGDVTFTFTFSEDVGTSFTVDDVTLTGGSKGAFTRLDGRHATLVARPPADSTGTLAVEVGAGAVEDLAGNPNPAGAAAEQAYDTPPAPTGAFVLTFDEAVAPVLTGFGGSIGSIVADPEDGSNQVAQVVKTAGAEIWAGVTMSTGPDFTVPVIPLTAGSSTMTARVWSPEAGVPVRLKVENSADGGVSVETDSYTTVAGGWETMTFDFASPVPGTPALDESATYDKVSVFFDFGSTGDGATYHLDDLTWP